MRISSGEAGRRPRPRREQRGVVLILALFVILILLVIVPQFRFSASIERELALNEVSELQMEALARAAILRAQSALLVDLEDDQAQEEGGDEAGGGGDGGAGADGAGEGAGAAAPGTHCDSLDEVWANGEFTLQMGEEAGFKTRIAITDEDSKLNVLLLFAEDEEYRREWRERFERLLDVFRDGEPEDLTLNEASDLVDRMQKWMEGDRSDDQLAVAPLASGDWRNFLERSVHAPLSLAELCLGGGIKPTLLYGFPVGEGDQQKWVPGLEQILTVWSNVELAEEKKAEDGTTPPDDPAADRNRPEAQGVNNGRINPNTASVAVLKSLFSDNDLPYASWTGFDEFRREALEELKREREELAGASDEEKERREREKEPDAADYPLKTIDDLRKVDGFSPDSSSLTPEKWNKLASLISVESNVFTITVMISSWEQPRRYYVARAVVWRRDQGAESSCIPIVPFERLPMSAVDLTAFAKEMDEWSESYSPPVPN
jgi:hypothetical protein